ncbi:DNA ligase [Bienertia sinuspersici]
MPKFRLYLTFFTLFIIPYLSHFPAAVAVSVSTPAGDLSFISTSDLILLIQMNIPCLNLLFCGFNIFAGPLIKHLSSLLKWTKNSPKPAQSGKIVHQYYIVLWVTDGPVVQFENGYLVETVVEGNAIGVVPYSIKVSQDGELFAVDSENSNIFRITPPLSQCMLSSKTS